MMATANLLQSLAPKRSLYSIYLHSARAREDFFNRGTRDYRDYFRKRSGVGQG
jgi:hypothetical protein